MTSSTLPPPGIVFFTGNLGNLVTSTKKAQKTAVFWQSPRLPLSFSFGNLGNRYAPPAFPVASGYQEKPENGNRENGGFLLVSGQVTKVTKVTKNFTIPGGR